MGNQLVSSTNENLDKESKMKKIHIVVMFLIALAFASPATHSLAASQKSAHRSIAQINKVSINTADAASLTTVPGIGPKTAEKIVEYRQKNGRFKTVKEITRVQGIGEKSLSKIRSYLTL